MFPGPAYEERRLIAAVNENGAQNVMPYSGSNARIRAALAAVAPLFAEQFAKVAEYMQPIWTGEGSAEETEEPEDFRNRIVAAIRAKGA
jgi:hypothetical protein